MSTPDQWFTDMRQRELDQFKLGDEVVVTLHGECPFGVKHGDVERGARGFVLAKDGGHFTNSDPAGHMIWVAFRQVLPVIGTSYFYAPGELRHYDMLNDHDWTPEERDALRAAQSRTEGLG